jgi:hypothetical protein
MHWRPAAAAVEGRDVNVCRERGRRDVRVRERDSGCECDRNDE